MSLPDGGAPEKPRVGQSFSRAARGYDGLAELQREIAHHMFAHLTSAPLQPSRVLDLGTGTGYCIPFLSQRFPLARLVALDLAEGMLRELRRSRAPGHRVELVNGDAECLPFEGASIDLIVSNLALQWCPNLPHALWECGRALVPGGWLVFTTFTAGTLWELRESWAGVDDYSHVNRFATPHELEVALARAGFSAVRMETLAWTLAYPDVKALMRELKGLGAHNVTANRPRGLTGKGRLASMMARYAVAHASEAGIPACFEVVFAAARLAG